MPEDQSADLATLVRGQAVVVYTFNPSTWEMETRGDMAGWRELYKAGGDRSLEFNLWFLREGIQSKDL